MDVGCSCRWTSTGQKFRSVQWKLHFPRWFHRQTKLSTWAEHLQKCVFSPLAFVSRLYTQFWESCAAVEWAELKTRKYSDTRGKDILAGRPALGLPLEQNSGIYGQKQGSLRSMKKWIFEHNYRRMEGGRISWFALRPLSIVSLLFVLTKIVQDNFHPTQFSDSSKMIGW